MSATTKPSLDWRLMAPIFMIVAIDSMGMGVILPLLPFYAERFGATPFAIGLLFAMFALCQFVSAPILGAWSDKIGRKPILIGSQLGTCLSLILLALSNSLPMLFFARILDGLTSGNLSVASAYAIDRCGETRQKSVERALVFHSGKQYTEAGKTPVRGNPATRKQAIGIVSAGVGVGLIVGPALSAFSAHLSPVAPVWVAAALSAASVLATTILLPMENSKKGTGTMVKGTGARSTLLSKPALSVLGLLSCFYMAVGMMMGGLAIFLAHRFAWNGAPLGATQIGLIFTGTGMVNILVQLVLMKRVGEYLSDKQIVVAGLMLMATGYAVSGSVHALSVLGLALAGTALGSSLVRPTLTSTLSLCVPSEKQGAVMGVNQSLMAIANVIAPLAGGLLLDHGWYLAWVTTLASLLSTAAVASLVCFAKGWWPSDATNMSHIYLKG